MKVRTKVKFIDGSEKTDVTPHVNLDLLLSMLDAKKVKYIHITPQKDLEESE